jgi:DNA helicase IV
VAEAFYRATGRHPMGIVRRRHFSTDGRTLLAIEDEVFRADADGGGDDLELVGPGALLAALQRSRSGQMRDIVATVQREQDEIIRSELPGVMVVQGGPGTGKTAVALHRAAYLLYTHRFPLEQQGVLVVGPNQVFLRYIDQVLPSLGESGVVLTTIAGLVADVRARGVEPSAVVGLKGDARMARVVAQAVADRQRGLREDLTLGFGALTLRLAAASTAAIVTAVRRRPGSHNRRRRQIETLVYRALFSAYETAVERAQRSGLAVGITDDEGEDLTLRDFVRLVRREPSVLAALDRMWPRLTAEELLHDLFGAPPLVALACRKILSVGEHQLLIRPRSASLADVPWTPADLPLLDEARALLGPVRAGRAVGRALVDAGDDDGVRAYGHIVVDEAQDLAPMAVRMLARRSISGSMTLVGDIGQATSVLAPAGWDDVLALLPFRRPPRLTGLTVNYRTPAEIMAVAIEVLAAADLRGVPVPRSVRSLGRLPSVVQAETSELPAVVAVTAAEELAAVGDGTVAVIAPVDLIERLGRGLANAGVPWGEPDRSGLSAPVTLLPLVAAKGLEFDAVVVVEPAGIVAEAAQGLRALFVALTRPTRRLVVVHAAPLPESLARGLELARSGLAEAPATHA